MKKILCMMMIMLIIVLGFVGCSDGETENEDVIRVGIDLKFPPFSDIDEDGNPIGLEPTIAYAFGEFLGKEVEIVDTDFSMLIPALETGVVDILIADMARTDERAKKVDFSDPYRYTYTLALVNKDYALANNITDEMSAEDFFALEGNNFVGLAGTMGVLVPESFGREVTTVTEIGSGIMEVVQGTHTSLVASNEIHSFHSANKESTIVYSGINQPHGSNFAVRLGDSALLKKANEFIASMHADGGLYDQIAPEYDKVVGEFLGDMSLGLDYITTLPQE